MGLQYETKNQTRIQILENQLAVKILLKERSRKISSRGFMIYKLLLGQSRALQALVHLDLRLVMALNPQMQLNPLSFRELSAMFLEEELRLKTCEGGLDVAFLANIKGKSHDYFRWFKEEIKENVLKDLLLL